MKLPILVGLVITLVLVPPCLQGAVIEYSYSIDGRLATADYGGIVYRYTYDHIGNMLGKEVEVLSTYDGDVDNNGVIDLSDSILALQVVTGKTSDQMVHRNSDVDNDQRIGLGEVIFILSTITEQE